MRLLKAVTLLIFIQASQGWACQVVTQCDYCFSNSQFQNVALSETPAIASGQDMLRCDAYVVNLQGSEARLYEVNKGHEPGFTYQWASEQAITIQASVAFADFFYAYESSHEVQGEVLIPGDIAPSAYQLPGNSAIESAVDDYIRSNHPTSNWLYTTFGILTEAISSSGMDLSSFLTVMVVFEDGSFGLFKLETIGLFSEWRIVEGSFQDADGNTIFFDSSSYGNQSGPVTGPGVGYLINRLVGGGWSVVGDDRDEGAGCDWSCDDVDEWQCTINCPSS